MSRLRWSRTGSFFPATRGDVAKAETSNSSRALGCMRVFFFFSFFDVFPFSGVVYVLFYSSFFFFFFLN